MALACREIRSMAGLQSKASTARFDIKPGPCSQSVHFSDSSASTRQCAIFCVVFWYFHMMLYFHMSV